MVLFLGLVVEGQLKGQAALSLRNWWAVGCSGVRKAHESSYRDSHTVRYLQGELYSSGMQDTLTGLAKHSQDTESTANSCWSILSTSLGKSSLAARPLPGLSSLFGKKSSSFK